MKKKLVLTGGSGLLAMNWAAQMRDEYDIMLIMHRRVVNLNGVSSYKVDISSITDLITFFLKIKPSLVIHTAGLTSVEICEKEPILAYKINVELASNVAIASSELGIKMVHISTDHLFPGNQKLVSEDACISPCNVYGLTKAKAEKKVMEHSPQALIVRTNFYGWGTSYRKSFSDVIITSLRENKTIELFDNVFYTPIITGSLISLTHALLKIDANGIYNIVSDKRVSKYEFGISLAETFDFDKSLIIKSYLSKDLELVKRPLDMSLSNKKISSLLNVIIGDIHDQIKLLKLKENNPEIKEIKKI